jgi:hypothetical protein
MQRKQGRLSVIPTQYDETSMFELAKSVQAHLARATHTNAPSLRYSIILEELQQELQCLLDRPEISCTRAAVDEFGESHGQPESAELALEARQWDGLDMDFPLDPELWLQLDTLLFSTVDLEVLQH